ncbi:MAG: hypothetical protein QG614_61 [Patescibacteria group bacterium]|nr:hypothetical protein [Patescibacteria group bacterium]
MKKYLYFFIFLIIILSGFYAYFILGNQLRAARADVKAEDYINKMYQDYDVAGHSCQGDDTNHDTYVTCDYRVKEKSSGYEKTIILQCPTFWKSFMATACKEQGLLINQN